MARAPASTIPAVMTALIGRDDDLRRVLATLERPGTRLVTLTGLGGIGKTRLAVSAAAAARPRYRDGVLFVELAAVTDAGQVVPAVAAAAGIREHGADPVAERLLTLLRPRQLLLVLDNVEHVLAATPAVMGLLAECPGLTILATSRVALRVRGERELGLEPLPVPEAAGAPRLETLAANAAVALFAERAAQVNPRFVLTEASAPLVAAICRRLDGIPLAIELAAAWIRMLPPGTLLARLDDRLGLLDRGSADAPDRQRTLRATLEWSERLLGGAERAVFRRCGLFVGSWSLAAAEAVATGWGGDPEPIDVLRAVGALVDHGLLTPVRSDAAEPRFAMLETVREFALDRLAAAAEGPGTGAALTAWGVACAEAAQPGLFGPEQAAWLDLLEAERTTLRLAAAGALDRGDAPSAIRIGNALGRFWLVRGHQPADHAWLARAIDLAAANRDAAVREARAFALLLLGNSWFERGELPEAIAAYRESAAAAAAEGAAAVQAGALLNLGIVSAQIGEIAAAHAAAAEALALNRGLGNRASIGKDLIILGGFRGQLGDQDGAEAMLAEALAINLELGDIRVVALNMNTSGEVARARGQAADAARLCRQSLALSEAIGEKRGMAAALANLGWLALDRGDTGEAPARFFAAMRLRHEIGDRWNLADCAEGVAVATVFDHPGPALGLLAAAAAIKAASGGSRPRPETAQATETARSRLGPEAAATIWADAAAAPTSDGLLSTAAGIAGTGDRPVAAVVPGAHPGPRTTPVPGGPVPPIPANQGPGHPGEGATTGPAARPTLSPREREVLGMIVTGHQDREIADALFLTTRTVSWHVANILAKLGASSRVTAAVRAIREGLLEPEPTASSPSTRAAGRHPV